MNIDLILKSFQEQPIINNQIYFNFDNTEIIGNISDASIVLILIQWSFKDDNYLENTNNRCL